MNRSVFKSYRRQLPFLFVCSLYFILVFCFSSMAKTPKLYVAGDSTAAEFSDNYYYPRYGWGTQLEKYFDLEVVNLALSGTSSKSYTYTDAYTRLLAEASEGDYVLIGFGHNDERAESGRYTDPSGTPSTEGSTQYWLYKYYIEPLKEKGANPILVTPIVRRDAGDNYSGVSGHITSSQATIEGVFAGGDYPKAIRRLAVGKCVPLCDLTARTKAVYEKEGASAARIRHAQTSANPVSVDNTHTNLFGASWNAWCIADELKKSSSSIKAYILDMPEPDSSILTPNEAFSSISYTRPQESSHHWQAAGLWQPTVFGDIDGYEHLNDIYFTLLPQSDSSVTLKSGRDTTDPDAVGINEGKIATKSDGIAMYYQAVPADKCFTLSADASVCQLGTGNQVSFGLMVRDEIYVDMVSGDTLGDYVAAGPLYMDSQSPWCCFARKSGLLTKGSDLSRLPEKGQNIHLEIRKGKDGYTCTFGDNPPVSQGFDFPLTSLDADFVYAGVFTAKNAGITFYNMKLEIED